MVKAFESQLRQILEARGWRLHTLIVRGDAYGFTAHLQDAQPPYPAYADVVIFGPPEQALAVATSLPAVPPRDPPAMIPG